jgi:hypothetical protein
MTKCKPFLSIFEITLEKDLEIEGKTITKTMEDTDIDNFIIESIGTTNTRTIEDSDYDNGIFINE